MLVLSRKVGQDIQIGPDIVVTVVEVKGRMARIGIRAPRAVRVLRSELIGCPAPPSASPPPATAPAVGPPASSAPVAVPTHP
jgi:carbon storage regulator